jgi:hypothetical protein
MGSWLMNSCLAFRFQIYRSVKDKAQGGVRLKGGGRPATRRRTKRRYLGRQRADRSGGLLAARGLMMLTGHPSACGATIRDRRWLASQAAAARVFDRATRAVEKLAIIGVMAFTSHAWGTPLCSKRHGMTVADFLSRGLSPDRGRSGGLTGRIATTSTGLDDCFDVARVDLAAEPPRLARLHSAALHGLLRPAPVRGCSPSAGCGGLGGRNAEGRSAEDTIDPYPPIGGPNPVPAAPLPAGWQSR